MTEPQPARRDSLSKAPFDLTNPVPSHRMR